MSTLTALARARAVSRGIALPVSTVRHMHISDHPLVLVALTLAGEANAPLAVLVGDNPRSARLLVVSQPRNCDQRFAFAARLAEVVVGYIDACRKTPGACAVTTQVQEPMRGKGWAAAEGRPEPQLCTGISGWTLAFSHPQWSRCLVPRLARSALGNAEGQSQPTRCAARITPMTNKVILSHSSHVDLPIQAMSAGQECGSGGSGGDFGVMVMGLAGVMVTLTSCLLPVMYSSLIAEWKSSRPYSASLQVEDLIYQMPDITAISLNRERKPRSRG